MEHPSWFCLCVWVLGFALVSLVCLVWFFVGSEAFDLFQITLLFILLDCETTWKTGDIIDPPFAMVCHGGKALALFWWCQGCMWSCSDSLNRTLLIKFWQLFFIFHKGQQLVSSTDWPLKQYKQIWSQDASKLLLQWIFKMFFILSNSIMHFMAFLRALLRTIILPEIPVCSSLHKYTLNAFLQGPIFFPDKTLSYFLRHFFHVGKLISFTG